MFEKIGGLPAHPLFVHFPLVLGPLAAIMAIAMLVPAWRDRLAWPTAVLGVAFAASAIFAAESGEWLAQAMRIGPRVEEHEEAAELLRNIGIVFAVLLVAFAALRKRLPSALPTVAAVLLALLGGFTIYQVIETGHEGATLVWQGQSLPGESSAGS